MRTLPSRGRSGRPDGVTGVLRMILLSLCALSLCSAGPAGRYESVPIPGAHAFSELRARLRDDQLATVLKINRLDLDHVLAGDTLAVPDSVGELMTYAPFPAEVRAAAEFPTAILVSLRVQAVGCYERGRLVRWAPASTGREDKPTLPGVYHTNWKSKERTSTFNDEWLLRWYVNIENDEGVSFHLYALPGYPASHACIRLAEDDAVWLYDWIDQWTLSEDGRRILTHGTPVVVFGDYAFRRRPPWKNLPADPYAVTIGPAEADAAAGALLPGSLFVSEEAPSDSEAAEGPSPTPR